MQSRKEQEPEGAGLIIFILAVSFALTQLSFLNNSPEQKLPRTYIYGNPPSSAPSQVTITSMKYLDR